jgi:hypothetical protein
MLTPDVFLESARKLESRSKQIRMYVRGPRWDSVAPVAHLE